MRIALTTRTLARGGVPVQLVNLARGLSTRGHVVTVIVLYAHGPLTADLVACGVEVCCLEKRGRWDLVGPMLRYVSLARKRRFDVMYSFLPVENLMSLLVASLIGAAPIWGLRGASQDLRQHGLSSLLLWRLQGMLLGFPRAVISNSRAALTERGIEPSRRFVIVPNGIDTERFRPDADARMQVRDELRVQHGERLVGCMARLDPVKDHHSMLRAMALIAARRSEVRFVVVGAGSPGYDAELKDAATELRIDTLVRWMGERADVERILNALDVYVSASTAEGFSNSLAESMACGVPPVVTDVGDSRDIVACHGTTVVPRNAQALTDGVIDWLDRDSPDLRCRRRDWIVQQFGVEQMVDRTLAVFAAALSS